MTIVRYAHIACLGHAFESPACRCGPPVRIMYWVVRSEAAREAQMSLCVDGLTFTFPPLDIEGKKRHQHQRSLDTLHAWVWHMLHPCPEATITTITGALNF